MYEYIKRPAVTLNDRYSIKTGKTYISDTQNFLRLLLELSCQVAALPDIIEDLKLAKIRP
jgi:hypothetical protein